MIKVKLPIRSREKTITSYRTFSYKRLNLQIFAGEKTEKATSKKRSQAREKGQVLKSTELAGSVVLLALFMCLKIFGSNIYEILVGIIKLSFIEFTKKSKSFDTGLVIAIIQEMMLAFLKICGPIFAVAMILGVIMSIVQTGPLFILSPLKPNFAKLNPISGAKRLFSLRSIVELVKSIIKVLIILYITYVFIKSNINNILQLMDVSTVNGALYIFEMVIDIAIRICVVFIILGVIDYLYQWWQYEKDLKMSKDEIKDEFKQVEGNPEIKGKIKQKQREIAFRRMLQDVPQADVVITNPTHYAVAIKYDRIKSDAPIVLAKGVDYLAKRIKEIAKENKVEVVENKQLARNLYNIAEIGSKIPQELYQAVAEVLAFVYSLKKGGK